MGFITYICINFKTSCFELWGFQHVIANMAIFLDMEHLLTRISWNSAIFLVKSWMLGIKILLE